jgi:enoyl-CoA hydratase/carnithine racemase
MELETLEVEVEGSVGRLRLNRPEKRNPLGADTLRELAAAARWFDAQAGVKVVVVRGAGGGFSAGADLAAFSGPAQGSPRDAADLGREMADALGRSVQWPKPPC